MTEKNRAWWAIYCGLVGHQFEYGGVKYGAQAEGREMTDKLTAIYGLNGMLWTMHKYWFRFRGAVGREKDVLKLACYVYILWLKKGYFMVSPPQGHLLDVNVEIKRQNFEMFAERARLFRQYEDEDIDDMLRELKGKQPEDALLTLFNRCHDVWCEHDYQYIEKHDEDVGPMRKE